MSKKQPKARLDHFLLIRVICAHKYRLIKRVKIQSPEKLAWIRLYVCVQERRAKDWDSRGLAGPSPVRQTPREGTWCSWWKKKVINRMLLEPWCPGSLTISQHPLWPEKCFWSSGSSTPKSYPSRVAELATWQPFVGGKNGHENFRQARIYNFRDKCVVFARNHKFAKLT